MALRAQEYALFGGRTLYIAYYRDVKNSATLRQQILSQQVDAALINAEMIAGLFQLHVAASRALLSAQSDSLTTNSIHSELVFNLSGSRNVTDSLRRFGISNETTQLVVCAFDDASLLEKLQIEGTREDVDKIGDHLTADQITALKKLYKIQDTELEVSSLSDAIVCRIATKNVSK
ncbi:unnamed protein product [Aphanomyces euteiches]|uniref:EKC/KEOPS complex subunit CGI121 n=1 Tax=Aphanomyces euteiches TaxID=100861 RepID=A0A6G0W496_9STRA|nr:hypothetical protein Ae201684_019098 [Aphanomyces euteiches]KAH9084249.1 hypothetical protein Ae201684P_020498 [Aphanomyces euteiches]KAH9143259.1 hypothetical protein AeRB84_012726 [Aphanomyces euteiches]